MHCQQTAPYCTAVSPRWIPVWVMLNEPAVTFYESQDFALHVHDADGTRGGSSTAEAVAACCRSP